MPDLRYQIHKNGLVRPSLTVKDSTNVTYALLGRLENQLVEDARIAQFSVLQVNKSFLSFESAKFLLGKRFPDKFGANRSSIALNYREPRRDSSIMSVTADVLTFQTRIELISPYRYFADVAKTSFLDVTLNAIVNVSLPPTLRLGKGISLGRDFIDSIFRDSQKNQILSVRNPEHCGNPDPSYSV